MSRELSSLRNRVSPDVWQAAQARLPLRLPRPEETGLQPAAAQSRLLNARLRGQSARNRVVLAASGPVPGELPLSDSELEAMAQRVLLQSGVRGFTKLHVEVRDATATLYGKLPTDIERQVAMQLVRRVNGICRIEHEIVVEPLATPADSTNRKPWVVWLAVMSLVAVLASALLGAIAN